MRYYLHSVLPVSKMRLLLPWFSVSVYGSPTASLVVLGKLWPNPPTTAPLLLLSWKLSVYISIAFLLNFINSPAWPQFKLHTYLNCIRAPGDTGWANSSFSGRANEQQPPDISSLSLANHRAPEWWAAACVLCILFIHRDGECVQITKLHALNWVQGWLLLPKA